jgi:acetyl-CoA acetyltransferase
MADLFERDAIISGIGISRIGRKTGIPGLELTRDACEEAIADAGLRAGDIDGIASIGETPLHHVIADLGIDPGYTGGGYATGGLLSPVIAAFHAVSTGRARHVLVYRTVQMMAGSIAPPEEPTTRAAPVVMPPEPDPQMEAMSRDTGQLLTFHAYSASNWLAMHCRRHMHLYGTTKEQLGWLAINSRRNAGLNPRAAYREPITMADYLAARPISDPFGLLDCDVPIDGSIAVVISHESFSADCPKPPIRVEAIGGATGEGGWDQRDDYPKMASADAAADLWSRSDLKPADVDIAQLYDGFTFITMAWLEALGFCGEGEAGPFVDGAERIALEGELPVNTYGGQLSAGRMHGYWILHEACAQLRGECGDRQVDAPEVAVVAAGGGPFAGCMLLTR